jgi:hypothetical protein
MLEEEEPDRTLVGEPIVPTFTDALDVVLPSSEIEIFERYRDFLSNAIASNSITQQEFDYEMLKTNYYIDIKTKTFVLGFYLQKLTKIMVFGGANTFSVSFVTVSVAYRSTNTLSTSSGVAATSSTLTRDSSWSQFTYNLNYTPPSERSHFIIVENSSAFSQPFYRVILTFESNNDIVMWSRLNATQGITVSSSLIVTGSVSVNGLMTLQPINPLPSVVNGSIAYSSSGDFYFGSGSAWKKLTL